VASIQDEAFIVAQNNELFARVPLNGQLNEDTDAGKCSVVTPFTYLLFSSVTVVMLVIMILIMIAVF